jgi:hypothetical protein
MNSVVRRILLLPALAWAFVVALPAAGAGQIQDPPREDLFEMREGPGGRPMDWRDARRGRGGRVRARGTAAVEAPAAPSSTPSPASGGSSPAPAVDPPAAPTSPGGDVTFSDDAPDTPPDIGVIGGDSNGPSPTPEPSSLLLMGTGIAGLYRLSRRRAR